MWGLVKIGKIGKRIRLIQPESRLNAGGLALATKIMHWDGTQKKDTQPHAACPFHIALKQVRRSNGRHPVLVAQSASCLLAVRFVERNQKGNYFRETQFSGRSSPSRPIGWFWSNDVPNVTGTCVPSRTGHTFSTTYHPP